MKTLLLLASASPRRKELIRALRRPFKIVLSSYKEARAKNLPRLPQALAMHHALQKARNAILPRNSHQKAIIIGADTIVVFRGMILGKPRSRREAAQMLRLLSGHTHSVITGLALIWQAGSRQITSSAKTRVTFKKLNSEAILSYLNIVNPLDKAGAYAIQDGPKIIKAIQGSRSNVIGLPIELLKAKLAESKRWFL